MIGIIDCFIPNYNLLSWAQNPINYEAKKSRLESQIMRWMARRGNTAAAENRKTCKQAKQKTGNVQTWKLSDKQESMTCTFPTDAAPCSEATNFYKLNDNFGVIPVSTAQP